MPGKEGSGIRAMVVERAFAKVNLALHVTGRRDDGYHEIDTIAVFADIGDRLSLAPAGNTRLAVSGRFSAGIPADAENLACRAASVLADAAGLRLGVGIDLEKNIPAGAGLGGGSADAAAVLRGLNRLWRLDWPLGKLAALGAAIGADVSMCLHSVPLRAGGAGEVIRPINLCPSLPLVLVWPGVGLSTKAVFRAFAEEYRLPLADDLGGWRGINAVAEWLERNTGNDLEGTARRLEPDIEAALAALRRVPGCLLARMTGSGSACFGLFGDREAAAQAAGMIAKNQPHWWVRPALSQGTGSAGQ